jgi:hypothetical protein
LWIGLQKGCELAFEWVANWLANGLRIGLQVGCELAYEWVANWLVNGLRIGLQMGLWIGFANSFKQVGAMKELL